MVRLLGFHPQMALGFDIDVILLSIIYIMKYNKVDKIC